MLNKKVSKAFTLLELIVVIVVLGILAMLAVPTFNTVKEKSADSVAIKNAQAVQRDIDAQLALGVVPVMAGIDAYKTWDINGSTYNFTADLDGLAAGLTYYSYSIDHTTNTVVQIEKN